MLERRRISLAVMAWLALTTFATAQDSDLDVHDDYYRGFAQGAYYGLMLAGVDYHVAWCMKAELEYEAAGMGTGAAFQQKLEALLETCQRQNSDG